MHTDKDCPRTLVTICMDCLRMPVTSHLHRFVIGEPHSECQAPRWNLSPQAHPQLRYIVWFLGASVPSLLM